MKRFHTLATSSRSHRLVRLPGPQGRGPCAQLRTPGSTSPDLDTQTTDSPTM